MARKQIATVTATVTPAAVIAAPTALLALPAPAPVVVPAPAPAEVPAAKAGRTTAVYMAQMEAAKRGVLPAGPDFSALTHNSYRKLGHHAVATAEKGDMDELRHLLGSIAPKSSTRIMIHRYCDIALVALEARAAAAVAA